MRFSAVALFAGAALASTEVATSTAYSTEYLTITSCAPEVTNCPARTHTKVYPVTTSTAYSTNVYTAGDKTVTEIIAVSTTVCPVTAASTGKSYYNTTVGAVPSSPAAPVVGTGVVTLSSSAAAAACPTYSVKTISTSVTTVVPTVIYETVAIPCPSSAPASAGTGTGTGSVVVPTSPVTAGAGNIAFPGALAAAAGLLAVILA